MDEGFNVVCIGVSQLLHLVQPEMKTVRAMMDRDHMPDPVEVAEVASSSVKRLRTVEPYLFPPLIQFETMKASEYVSSTDQDQVPVEDPDSE